jgi:hypothetical protein
MAINTSGGNFRSSNPDNYQLPGGIALFVREKGSLSFDDWIDLGNIVDPNFSEQIENLDHFSQRRGQRAKDRSDITQRGMLLNFSIDEINIRNLQFAFGNFQTPTASSVAIPFDDTFTNPGGAGVITLGRTNLDATITVRSSDHEVATVYVGGGVDYTFNAVAGTVTIEAGGALNLPASVPELHITYADTFDSMKFEGFSGESVEVEAKFVILTKAGVHEVYVMNNCLMKNNGDIGIGDGTAYRVIPLQLDVLVDSSDKLVELHVLDRPGA